MFQKKKVVQKIKTYFIFNNFFPQNRSVCAIMWKNVTQRDRPKCWIYIQDVPGGMCQASGECSLS